MSWWQRVNLLHTQAACLCRFLRMLAPLSVACALAQPALAGHSGDINTDAHTDLADLLWGIQTLTGMRTLSDTQAEEGDVAPLIGGYSVPDGSFNLGDVVVLYRVIAGDIMLSFAGVPDNQFNIGDSIGEGQASHDDIGALHHETVWSTGYDSSDTVNSLNERLEVLQPANYYENNVTRDSIFNHAKSGAMMADFLSQAQAVVAASAQTPTGKAGKVAVFLGNNDVCASSMTAMTDPTLFNQQFRDGLDLLAASPATKNARIDVVSIPAIYWLWNAKYSSTYCRLIWTIGSVCQSLLSSAKDDCASATSRLDPDNDYAGDGSNCHRRKLFHRAIRDDYNPKLHDAVQEYHDNGLLPNARYIDIFDVMFQPEDVNNGDCFHPSVTGHALLADTAWCRSPLGSLDAACGN
jgi:lysophospholipase L1-like esterase